jgi:S1-C subfamily serine protease
VSEGIVSASGRNFDDILYVQTTAGGKSGQQRGPLLDTQGNVVGVVTLKAIFQEGIAFALPIRYMRDFSPIENPSHSTPRGETRASAIWTPRNRQ